MRLIDADALIEEANYDGAYGYVDAKQISDAPTINAVTVVRCKDCTRCVTYKGVPFCNKWRTFPEVELDGFCSYGERKEGADNEP